jgi:hypothetical protein
MLNLIGREPAADIRFPPEVAENGTYEGWRAAINAAVNVQQCPHWRLGVAAGFVGPVLAKCVFDTCGINFSGATSRGKTTAVALGVSPWTSPLLTSGGLLRSMRATENSIEMSARQSNHMILGLDELAHVDGQTVGRTIYFLSGGISKGRMSSQITPRPQHSWRTFVLLSSEKSLAQKVAGDGGQWTGGMAVRFPDVDCSDVDTNVPQDTLSEIAAIYRNYGSACVRFLVAFKAAGLHREPDKLRRKILLAAANISGNGADGARQRAALPFALIGVCGNLAQQFNVLPKSAQINEAVKWGWQRFASSVEAQALDPEAHAFGNLRRWIAEHWDVAIKKTDTPYRSSRTALGWYDNKAIYIPTARISEAIGGALSERAFVHRLDRAGLLLRRTDDHRAAIRSVPQVGKVDVYCLDREKFEPDVC